MDIIAVTEPLRRRPPIGHAIAVLTSLLATWLRFGMDGVLAGLPLLLPTAVVTVVTFSCGLGPGIVAAVLAWSLAKYFFIPPVGSLLPTWPAGTVGLLFYAMLAGIIVGLIEMMVRTYRAQKRGEEELLALNASLEQRVEDRTAALHAEIIERSEAQEQVRQLQKMQSIGQLTGGIAHDFNNLMTVIRGSVDMLKRETISDERRNRYIAAIGDTAERATKLTSQLLAFARRQSLSPTLFDAGESLEELATMMRTLAGPRIMVTINAPEQPYHLLADRTQFDTAIINMAINARDAMAGEGELTITTRVADRIPALRGHRARDGDFVAVAISDNGSGIAVANLEQIFEPFFTTKGVGEGTGLGLSQVIGFATQSGGDVQVDSSVGQGTTFTLYLPRAHPATIAPTKSNEREAVATGGVCVLVVEDNAEVGDFATQALRELGYDSVLARDAEQALVELGKNCDRFHIVFSDVVMPGRSGLELGNEIRRLYPEVPIVLTSGYSDVLSQDSHHGFELVHKPYSMEQLASVISKAARHQSA